jgi:ankyrin repeat protein
MQAGADPNKSGDDGATVFHLVAACAGPESILAVGHSFLLLTHFLQLKMLLMFGGRPDPMYKGMTPLAVAAKHGNDEAMMILLKNGANPNIVLGGGHTVLRLVTDSGLEHVRSCLSLSGCIFFMFSARPRQYCGGTFVLRCRSLRHV